MPHKGDASIPTPLHTAPAPTRQGDQVAVAPAWWWNSLELDIWRSESQEV